MLTLSSAISSLPFELAAQKPISHVPEVKGEPTVDKVEARSELCGTIHDCKGRMGSAVSPKKEKDR